MDTGSGSVTLTFSLPNPVMPRFLGVKDCAKALGIGYQAMYDILRTDTGPPYIHLNGRHTIRISYEDFMQWIGKHRKKGNSCTP
jgi:predicted DNA-binding transcriptional regulator AlpA